MQRIYYNVNQICRSLNKMSLCSRALVTLKDTPTRQPDGEADAVVPSRVTHEHSHLPLMTSRTISFPNRYRPAKQAWLESLSTIEDEKQGIIDLHPDVFATFPRLDILHNNILWQRYYKHIDYRKAKNRAEMRGGGRKPWPQKGSGKARHGSNRSPLWIRGGKIHGPRGPTSFFYMLPVQQRALGLRVALSVKYAQNDLHIVDSLELPDDDPQYLEKLASERHWGYSVLFVDDGDYLSRNMSIALESLPSFNAVPVYGLSVFSMLKHETLVLTLAAVDKIEEKLLYQMHKPTPDPKFAMTRQVVKEPYVVPKDAPEITRRLPLNYP